MKTIFHLIYISLLGSLLILNLMIYLKLSQSLDTIQKLVVKSQESKKIDLLKPFDIIEKKADSSFKLNTLKTQSDIIKEISSFIPIEKNQLDKLNQLINEYNEKKEKIFSKAGKIDDKEYLNELYKLSQETKNKIMEILSTEQYKKFLENEFDMLLGLAIPKPEDENTKK